MRRVLPLWLLAVFPATLVGHALAYALSRQTQVDGAHAYFLPALDITLASLFVACIFGIGCAFLRRRLFALDAGGPIGSLWAKLAPAQLAFFTALELLERHAPTPAGYVVQIAVALVVAAILYSFARVLRRCASAGDAAEAYLRRLFSQPSFLRLGASRQHFAIASHAHAGRSRFKRPPPFA